MFFCERTEFSGSGEGNKTFYLGQILHSASQFSDTHTCRWAGSARVSALKALEFLPVYKLNERATKKLHSSNFSNFPQHWVQSVKSLIQLQCCWCWGGDVMVMKVIWRCCSEYRSVIVNLTRYCPMWCTSPPTLSLGIVCSVSQCVTFSRYYGCYGGHIWPLWS